jgi:Ni,Fe-hydrogenase I cytochrome b subunit
VEVFDRQQLAHPVIYPLVTLCSTTIRAVPVTTTMILMMDILTRGFIALVCVDAQPYGMAFGQLSKYHLRIWIEGLYVIMSEYFLL